MYPLIRPLLFALPPETAHHIALASLRLLQKTGLLSTPQTSTNTPLSIMGMTFPNRVGLAAGLDKNGEYIDALNALGFAFLEVGTVTPKPQYGNPKPRLFRISQADALINRMGFNNQGVDYLVEQIKKSKFKGILGINIGKNANTPIEKAIDDYLLCLNKVYPYASYVTINISSPNTTDLRQLQRIKDLDRLLFALKKAQQKLADQHQKYVPMVIKIAPDLNEQEITDIATLLLAHRIDGVIATNTTTSRREVSRLPHGNETGGLSGKPLFNQSLHVVQQLHQRLQNEIPIIACGGISSPEQMKQMLAAGASLVQIYTGLIYQGPQLCRSLLSCVNP